MALTRANIESILIRRCGSLMTVAGLDGTTVDGTNTDLNDPIGYAIRKVGETVDDPTSVDDTDAARVGSDDYDQLFDLAELRALKNTRAALLRLVNYTAGPRKEQLSDMAKGLQEVIEDLQEQIADEYGTLASTLTAGVIDLDFIEKSD